MPANLNSIHSTADSTCYSKQSQLQIWRFGGSVGDGRYRPGGDVPVHCAGVHAGRLRLVHVVLEAPWPRSADSTPSGSSSYWLSRPWNVFRK
jgi:hypothetical protein